MKNNIKRMEATEFNNVKEIIYNSAKVHKDRIAFVIKHKDENKNITYENITYERLLEDVNAFGAAMYSLGFKGKRVAVIGKNRYEWVQAHLANLLGGIVSVPLDKDLQVDELENSLIRSKANAIVLDNKLVPLIEEIKSRGNTELTEYITMDEAEGFKCVKELTNIGKEIIASGDREYLDCEIDNNAMNILLFTSGTTSKSKAVMLSQKNIAVNVYDLQCMEPITKEDTNIAFLPFHHIFGSTCIILTMAVGIRNVFPDGLKYIKQNMKEYEVSMFVGVPVLTEAIYKALMKEIDKQGKTKLIKTATKISNFLLKLHIDVRRKLFKQVIDGLGGKLRFVISGGAPADPASIKGFNEMGIVTLQGYGLSETGPVICAENYKCRKPGTVGLPMPSDELEIVNPDADGIGEVRVKGPNVMLGYYEMPELTEKVLKDGWFYTGDLGYFDEDGYLVLTGRSKDMIVLKNGKKVFPEELETVVNRLELVEESMVFAIPEKNDPNDFDLAVKAVYNKDVIKEKYKDKSEEELKQILWEQIKQVNLTFPKYKHIKKLYVTHDELIKTTTKKVKRPEEMKLINKMLEEENN